MHACRSTLEDPTIAKGLGGGYQPVGALLASSAIVDTLRKGSGAFMHSHTYIGHPVACAAALAVQRVVKSENLVAKVARDGAYMIGALRKCLGGNPYVGDIRGRGLLIGIELVEDRASKRPFPPALKLHAKVKGEAMKRGLLVYPMGGTIDGERGDHVLLAPPFIATRTNLDAIVERLQASLEAVRA